MAQMLPQQIADDVRSGAERRLFADFQRDTTTTDWTVLHSLNLSRHVRQVCGEIDFLVVAPNLGVFALEVKGGGVRCEAGVWIHTNRDGDMARRSKSPFQQAQDNMQSLRARIGEQFGEMDAVCEVIFGWGVLFPDTSFRHDGMDFEREQIYDADTTGTPSDWVRTLAAFWKHKLPLRRASFSKSDADRLVRFLRPDFDYPVALLRRLSDDETQIERMTREQCDNLDILEGNPRVLIEGGAGTGKTFLALEQARRWSAENRRVLLLCYNRFLGDWLAQHPIVTGSGGGITAMHLHRYIEREIIATSDTHKMLYDAEIAPQRDAPNFYDEIVPTFARDVLADSRPAPFDALLVDEAQDIMRPAYLNLLGDLVTGGLSDGRWGFFGDFARQVLYADLPDEAEAPNPTADDAEPAATSADAGTADAVASADARRAVLIALLEERAYLTRARLRINCRNTRRIGSDITHFAGVDESPFRPGTVEGDAVQYSLCDGEGREKARLEEIVAGLMRGGVLPRQITILSPRKRARTSLAGRAKLNGVLVLTFGESWREDANAIRFATIHSFKGLESEVVILLGVDKLTQPHGQQVLYVGMSRARLRLYVLLRESARADYNRLMQNRPAPAAPEN